MSIGSMTNYFIYLKESRAMAHKKVWNFDQYGGVKESSVLKYVKRV